MNERSARPGLMRRLLTGAREKEPDPSVWHPQGIPYPRLLEFNIRANGPGPRSGVYLLWHLGVRPRWLRAAGAIDLAAALTAASRESEVVAADANGGVFVAWAYLPVASIPSAAGSLAAQLKPALQDFARAGEIAGAATDEVFPLPIGAGPGAPPAER